MLNWAELEMAQHYGRIGPATAPRVGNHTSRLIPKDSQIFFEISIISPFAYAGPFVALKVGESGTISQSWDEFRSFLK
jgi:hypothetical protein